MAIDVLLLAAGFGKRLRPLTAETPKPLLPVCGIPLIQWRLDQLFHPAESTPEIGNVAINCCHLSEMMSQFIASHPLSSQLTTVIEPEILGTGGAIIGARHLLTSDPALVVNGDTISALPLSAAIAFHRKKNHLVTLMLSPAPLHRNVFVTGDRVDRIADTADDSALTYTGACLFSPALLEKLPTGGYHDLRETFLALTAAKQLGAFITSDTSPLLDIGTPERYLAAHQECRSAFPDYLDNHPIYPYQEHPSLKDTQSYIAPGVFVAPEATVRNSVILTGAEIGPEGRIANSIIGPGVKVNCPILKTVVSRMGQIAF